MAFEVLGVVREQQWVPFIRVLMLIGLVVAFGFGVIVMLVLAGPVTSGIATGGGIVTAAATTLLKRRPF